LSLFSYTALFLPFKIAFVEDNEFPTWEIFDYLIDAIFLADIVINFFSAYYDEFNNVVVNPKLICKRYITGWLLIDLIVKYFFFLLRRLHFHSTL